MIRDAAGSLDRGPDGPVRIERVDDADSASAPSRFDLTVCGAEPTCEEAARLAALLAPTGTILILDSRPHPQDLDALGPRVIRLNLSLALCGVFERHREQACHGFRPSAND